MGGAGPGGLRSGGRGRRPGDCRVGSGDAAGRDLADHDDLERARAVDALDPVELDVAGRRWPADPGQAPSRVEQGDRLRHQAYDLVGAQNAQVVVGDQRDSTTTLSRATIE